MPTDAAFPCRPRVRGISLTAVSAAVLAGFAGLAAACPVSESDACTRPEASEPEIDGHGLIEAAAFIALRPEHQAIVAEAEGIPELLRRNADLPEFVEPEPMGEEAYEVVAPYVSREVWEGMRPVHQRMLHGMAERVAAGEMVPAACFAPGTDMKLVEAFERILFVQAGNEKFQQLSRWSRTALDPSGAAAGKPTIITYSFPADGTFISNIGMGSGSNNLNAFLNSIYSGGPEEWKALFAQVFDRWGQLIGVDYVYEENDDGAPVHSNAGVAGVRGDVRIAGRGLDGNYGTLAYNNFPNDGDMVIDTSDAYFRSSSTRANNSRGFRNVIAHEHGHGLGMLHVCPIHETKLMEPYATNSFDGPQLDDILNGQAFYGDPYEPNATPAEAAELAAPSPFGGSTGVQDLAISNASDVDVYRIPMTASGLLSVSVRPTGTSYQSGPQTSSCSSGAVYDALRQRDLRLEIIRELPGGGFEVLADVNENGVGAIEFAEVFAQANDAIFVRVRNAGGTGIQGYRIVYGLSDAAAVSLVAESDIPEMLSPNGPTEFTVRVNAVNDTLAGSPRLAYDYSGTGVFSFADLEPVDGGPGMYTAVLPAAPCGATAHFYVVAEGAEFGQVFLPAAAPAETFAARVGDTPQIAADHDFEETAGWVAGAPGDTAASGRWVWAEPIGTFSGSTPVQPSEDFSEDGTFCFVTGNNSIAVGSDDVDGGITTLLSPSFDLSGAVTATVSYARWFSNSTGAAPLEDSLYVEVSNDGGQTWTTLEQVGPTGDVYGGWIVASFQLDEVIALTSDVRFRFIAEDIGGGSIVEAAIDEFRIDVVGCSVESEECPADFDRSGAADVNDLLGFLGAFRNADSAADFDGDGLINVNDLLGFLGAFRSGC